MLSATKLAHLKLTHLHTAATSLFLSSPPVSAHLSSTLSANASKSNIQLSESTWRKTCASCGYVQVPGWTCSVRVRGMGGEPRVGWGKKVKVEVGSEKNIGVDRVRIGTGANVVKDLSRKVRKRGKRTRGVKHRMEVTRLRTATREVKESAAIVSAEAATSSTPVKSRKRPKTTSATDKEPRMIYSCKICSGKTIHSLPKKPVAVSHDTATSENSTSRPTPQTSITEKPLIASRSKFTLAGALQQPNTTPTTATPTTTTSSINAAAKKRAKSRKNTLSSMLAKEAANRSAATSNGIGGFGFDLMDFMKTS